MNRNVQTSEIRREDIDEICNIRCDINELRDVSCSEYNLFSWLSRWSCCLWMLKAKGRERQYNELKRGLAEKLSKAYGSDVFSTNSVTKTEYNIKQLLDQYFNDICNTLKSSGYTVIDVKLIFNSKALIGVSQNFGSIAFEVSLSFNPIFNVPFIPGSEIKGAIRYGWKTVASEDLDLRQVASDLEHIIFGPEPRRKREYVPGALFFDFYPIRVENRWGRLLVPDVITPHYSDDKLDETEVNPNPVVHVSIADGAVFRGFIAITPFLALEVERMEVMRNYAVKGILNKIASGLIKSLILVGKLGLGARTSVDYGRFEVKDIGIECKTS